ncbi:MAG: hypothetical protein [Microviridae sp.]|nr:MAG: hypothetical protein [Microviridae sp.]
MYIHVFNSHRYERTRYCDALKPSVEIQSVDDGDGNFVLSVVPVDVSVPILCCDVDLKAKLSCDAPLSPVSSLPQHSLNIADSASTFLGKQTIE